MDGRKNRSDGAQSRRAILRAAADLASVRGLEGISISAIAAEVSMSKGGVYAHFGSKQALQLATIEAAAEIFEREVVAPASKAEPGLSHLQALCEYDLDYIDRGLFPGGCFFSAAAAEFCGRDGPVKERIVAANRSWMSLLASVIETAQERGEIDGSLAPAQLAFELNALIVSTNFAHNLDSDLAAIERGRRAIEQTLERLTDAPATFE